MLEAFEKRVKATVSRLKVCHRDGELFIFCVVFVWERCKLEVGEEASTATSQLQLNIIALNQ